MSTTRVCAHYLTAAETMSTTRVCAHYLTAAETVYY